MTYLEFIGWMSEYLGGDIITIRTVHEGTTVEFHTTMNILKLG